MPSIIPLLCTVAAAAAQLAPYPAVTIPDLERTVLMELYTGAGGPQWTDSQNWADSRWDPCTWFGVTCRTLADGPHVVWLELPNNGLSGSLPDTLGWLFHLEHLDLSHNECARPPCCRAVLPRRVHACA